MTGLQSDIAFIGRVLGYAVLVGTSLVLALGPVIVLARIALG